MTPDERERMNSLCAQIQEEKNYNRFIALLRDLNGLIERKDRRLDHHPDHGVWQRTRPWRSVRGTVKRIVRPVHPDEPEKVEIAIAAAEDLFREIRIENKLAKGFALDIPSKRTALPGDAVEAFMAVVFWVFHYTGDRHERFLRAPQE